MIRHEAGIKCIECGHDQHPNAWCLDWCTDDDDLPEPTLRSLPCICDAAGTASGDHPRYPTQRDRIQRLNQT